MAGRPDCRGLPVHLLPREGGVMTPEEWRVLAIEATRVLGMRQQEIHDDDKDHHTGEDFTDCSRYTCVRAAALGARVPEADRYLLG